jgi:hypothetical protein
LLGGQIETVAGEDRKMRNGERRSLRNQLLWLLLILPALFGFGKLEDSPSGAWPPTWQSAVNADRQLLCPVREDLKRRDQIVFPSLPLSSEPGVISFESSECASSGCMRSYLVALRYKETLSISSDDFPEGVDGMAVYYNAQKFHLFGDDWRDVGQHAILFAHKTIEFNAPRSAWFKVEFVCPDARAGGKVRLRASVGPIP